MASGIDHSKLVMSESRNPPRSHRLSAPSAPVHRSDTDDSRHMQSNHLDARPNNWEFSDWQPTKSFDGSRRRKKAKANPERQREKDQENEEAQARSLSQLSTPQSERHRHTPATFPRTKYTLPSQRAALERIKQQITFSDLDDVSTDNERNMERNIPVKRETLTDAEKLAAVGEQAEREEEALQDMGPDSNHIVSRLMEIRDYIKQAMSMMDTLHNTDDPHQATEIAKLRKLIQHLREQERSYMTMLQQLITLRDEDLLAEHITDHSRNLDSTHAKGDYPIDDVMSVDLDIRSVVSEATTEATQSSTSRPRIEDKLGIDVDVTVPNNVERRPNSLPEWDYVTEPDGAMNVYRPPAQAGADSSVELEALREQEQLLKRLVEQQEQLRALHGRQEALLAMQKDAERKLTKSKDTAAAAAAASAQLSDEDNTFGVREREDVVELVSDGPGLRRERPNNVNSQSDTEADELWHIPQLQTTDGHEELEHKLHKLQVKKRHMDQMLSELQNLRSHRYQQLVTALQDENQMSQAIAPVSSQSLNNEEPPRSANVSMTREVTVEDGGGQQNAQAAKMHEVRPYLEQLHDLMTYYDATTNANAQVPDRVFNATSQDNNMAAAAANYRISPQSRPTNQDPRQEANTQTDVTNDDNESDELSGNEENPWGDDPEIQIKVQKLNQAKERLHALKEIMTKIDQPSVDASALPQNSVLMAQQNEPRPREPRRSGEIRSNDGRPNENRVPQNETRAHRHSGRSHNDPIDPQNENEINEIRSALNKIRTNQNEVRDTRPRANDNPQNRNPNEIQPRLNDVRAALNEIQDIRDNLTEIRGHPNEVRVVRAQPGENPDIQRQPNPTRSRARSNEIPENHGPSNANDLLAMLNELREMRPRANEQMDIQAQLNAIRGNPNDILAALNEIQDMRAQANEVPGMRSQQTDLRLPGPGSNVRGPVDMVQGTNNESDKSGPSIEVLSDGEVPPESRREMQRESYMRDQLQELRQLEGERRRLQELSENLAALGGAAFNETSKVADKVKIERNNTEVTFAEEPQIEQITPTVTFSSNDELYDKMRKQRILREELRQKKRELEALMRKDRPRRGYAKNQDNQSDTVSTEAFGTSVVSADATMATWGGSTTENLESITEDNDGCRDNQGDRRDDDDYDGSEGMVQVEEEEEENEASGGTYTIEEDARGRRSKRGKARSFPRGLPRDDDARPRVWGSSIEPSPRVTEGPSASPSRQSQVDQQQHRENSLCQAVLNLSQTIQAYQGVPQMGANRYMNDLLQYQQSLMYNRTPLDHPPHQPSLSEAQYDRDSSIHSTANPYTTLPYPSPHFYPNMYSQNHAANPMFKPPSQQQSYLSPSHDRPPFPPRTNLQQTRHSTSQTSPVLEDGHYAKLPSSGRSASAAIRRNRDQAMQTDIGPVMNLSRLNPDGNPIRDPNNRFTPPEQGMSRVRATTSLPSQLQPPHRPSVRTSTEPTLFSTSGQTSSGGVISNIHGGVRAAQQQLLMASGRDQTTTNPTLFDTLRETIYAEVASLIYQNEARPHFLIELFRDLQLVTSDLMRQRSLTALRDVVEKYDTSANPLDFAACNTVTTSELTPSENQLPSDDDEFVVAQTRNNLNTSTTRDYKPPVNVLRNDIDARADDSFTSTPSSVCDNPFSRDALGDTVVQFDTSLRQIRQRERREKEAAREKKAAESITALSRSAELTSRSVELHSRSGDLISRSGDLTSRSLQLNSRSADLNISPKHLSILSIDGSESSASEPTLPALDTRRLEKQVQDIMTDIVPVLRENMENICSPKLLAYIKSMILSLTYNKHTSSNNIFQQQLSAILTSTLAKYEGRKLRDGSDGIVDDLTEVLYNELAYMRLSPGFVGAQPTSPKLADHAVDTLNDASKLVNYESEESEEMSSTTTSSSQSDNDDDDDNTVDDVSLKVESNINLQQINTASTKLQTCSKSILSFVVLYKESEMSSTTSSSLQSDNDDDDDNTVNDVSLKVESNINLQQDQTTEPLSTDAASAAIIDSEDKDDGAEVPYKNGFLEFTIGEMKPFTRIGSDEDDGDDDDESLSADDPSETAVSRDAQKEHNVVAMDTDDDDGHPSYVEEVKDAVNSGNSTTNTASVSQDLSAAVQDTSYTGSNQSTTATDQSHNASVVKNESLVNGHDFEEITDADLPETLTSYSAAEWTAKMETEQHTQGSLSGEIVDGFADPEMAGSFSDVPSPPDT